MTSTASSAIAQDTNTWGSKHFLLVALLFFFSGLSSLIYQVIWTRQLVFVFGSTSFASATVLSVFMGGLALGSYFCGKYADRMRNPFLWYGVLEAAIGIWALLIPFLLMAAIPIYKIFWQACHAEVFVFSLLRFFVMALILLPPTACMGATLPLLSKFVTSSLTVVGNRVGTLYSINTCGAVVGAIAAGFLLIPSLGLNVTTISAAVLNLLLGAAVYMLQKSWLPGESTLQLLPAGMVVKPDAAVSSGSAQASASPGTNGTPADGTEPAVNNVGLDSSGVSVATSTARLQALPPAVRWTMIAFGISGGLAMIQEVAWTRSLLLVIGSTTYAFSIMLATFLIGIFIGSIIMSRYSDRIKNPLLWFCGLQLALGAAGFLSLFLFNYLPYWNLAANYHYIDNPNGGMAVRFLLTGCVLLPITLCLGAIFPLAVKICTRDLEVLGKSIGTLYSVNTLGAIIGAFAAGFIIIPLLGSEHSLLWSSTANVILGCSLLMAFGPANTILRAVAGVVMLGLVIWSAMMPNVWDKHMILSSQRIRRTLTFNRPALPIFDKWVNEVSRAFQILFWKDGMCSNVAILKFPDGQTSLVTNGHIDASDRASDMGPQVIVPCIPLLLNPKATDVGDIGWGSGCTMGYSLLFPIKKMVCAEIEEEVVKTSPYFHSINLEPEKDPRLKIHINDGRNYMLATDELFDVVISEPSNPWQAGVCNLYTQDYFQVCHDRLKPGGIFTLWWQYNEVRSENLASVFSALKKVFKHVLVFTINQGNLTCIASDEPIKINLPSVDRSLQDQRIRSVLSLYTGITCSEDLAAKICLSEESLDRIAAASAPNTDDRNQIEFDVAKTYEQKSFARENAQWLIQNAGPMWSSIDWTGMTVDQQAEKLAAIAERAMVQDLPTSELWAGQSYKLKKNPFALSVQALIEAQKKGNFEAAYVMANEAVTKFPANHKWYCVRGIVALLGGAPLRARKDFEQALLLDPQNKVYKFRLAQTYLPDLRDWYQLAIVPLKDIGTADTNPAKVIELLQPIAKDQQFINQNPVIVACLGASYAATGKLQDGGALLKEYVKAKPGDRLAWSLAAQTFAKLGDQVNSQLYARKASELGDTQANKYAVEAAMHANNGKLPFALSLVQRSLQLNPAGRDARIVLWAIAPKYPDAEKLMAQLAKVSVEDAQAYQQLQAKKSGIATP